MPTNADLFAVFPEIFLTVAAGLILLIEAFAPKSIRHALAVVVALSATATAALMQVGVDLPGEVWSGLLQVDQLALFVNFYILAAVFLSVWMAGPFLHRTGAAHGELYALLLLAAVGAMIMAASTDALTLFLGLELLSIPLYVLNAFLRRTPVSVEAGLKYFVVGAFASGFIVYGFALLYGSTGTTNLVRMGEVVVERGSVGSLLAVGLAMVVGGLAFKLALFPCHGWAPDVYQGGPTPVTAFLSVVPKGAALIALLRFADGMDLFHLSPHWVWAAGIIAVASMTLGNLVAIAQRDIKRMLAYSGIAHMGYALVAVIAGGDDGGAAVLVYIAAYTLMNVGAFAAVSMLSERENEPHLISELAGQGWTRPVVALALTICLFSLAGIPPLVGFTGKLMVFRAAINQGLIWLAVLGVLNSLVSAFYYLRVVYRMYMQPLPKRRPEFAPSAITTAAASVSALAVVVIGVFPSRLLDAALVAIRYLTR